MDRASLTLAVCAVLCCSGVVPVSASSADRLPRLSKSAARHYSRVALKRNFKRAFYADSFKADRCGRKSRVRIRCRVGWFQGDAVYYGHTVIWLTRNNGGAVLWNYAYTVTRLDTYCSQVLKKPMSKCSKTYRVK